MCNWNSQKKKQKKKILNVVLNISYTMNFLGSTVLKKYYFHLKMVLLDCKKVQEHTVWISTLLTHYLEHEVQIIKFCFFKMITFLSFSVPLLKYYIFWSWNPTEVLKKVYADSIIFFYDKKSKVSRFSKWSLLCSKSDLEKQK